MTPTNHVWPSQWRREFWRASRQNGMQQESKILAWKQKKKTYITFSCCLFKNLVRTSQSRHSKLQIQREKKHTQTCYCLRAVCQSDYFSVSGGSNESLIPDRALFSLPELSTCKTTKTLGALTANFNSPNFTLLSSVFKK